MIRFAQLLLASIRKISSGFVGFAPTSLGVGVTTQSEVIMNETTVNSGAVAHAGKYLTFSLAAEKYGVEILKVIEINSMMHITKVPRCASHVKGVVNLRGKIIPVIDLRMLFGMEEKEYDEQTCTIMVHVAVGGAKIAIGMIVDRVLEVADFNEAEIAPAPDYGLNIESEFILGMGTKEHTGVVILIDIDRVLSGEEAHHVAELVEQQAAAERRA